MENGNSIRIDRDYVYSASGNPYRRIAPKSPSDVAQRRLPFVKRVVAKGMTYYYFAKDRAGRVRLPDVNDAGFDHAYLCQLARLEGEPEPEFVSRRTSDVYFIAGRVGAIKIGVAHRPAARLCQLQLSSPILLGILAIAAGGGISMERKYHDQFAVHRLYGEWFERHPDILAEINRLNSIPSIERGRARGGK